LSLSGIEQCHLAGLPDKFAVCRIAQFFKLVFNVAQFAVGNVYGTARAVENVCDVFFYADAFLRIVIILGAFI